MDWYSKYLSATILEKAYADDGKRIIHSVIKMCNNSIVFLCDVKNQTLNICCICFNEFLQLLYKIYIIHTGVS